MTAATFVHHKANQTQPQELTMHSSSTYQSPRTSHGLLALKVFLILLRTNFEEKVYVLKRWIHNFRMLATNFGIPGLNTLMDNILKFCIIFKMYLTILGYCASKDYQWTHSNLVDSRRFFDGWTFRNICQYDAKLYQNLRCKGIGTNSF